MFDIPSKAKVSRLADLFEALFETDELRRFTATWTRYQRLGREVLTIEGTRTNNAYALASALIRHGLVDLQLFAALLSDRGEQLASISRVAQAFEITLPAAHQRDPRRDNATIHGDADALDPRSVGFVRSGRHEATAWLMAPNLVVTHKRVLEHPSTSKRSLELYFPGQHRPATVRGVRVGRESLTLEIHPPITDRPRIPTAAWPRERTYASTRAFMRAGKDDAFSLNNLLILPANADLRGARGWSRGPVAEREHALDERLSTLSKRRARRDCAVGQPAPARDDLAARDRGCPRLRGNARPRPPHPQRSRARRDAALVDHRPGVHAPARRAQPPRALEPLARASSRLPDRRDSLALPARRLAIGGPRAPTPAMVAVSVTSGLGLDRIAARGGRA